MASLLVKLVLSNPTLLRVRALSACLSRKVYGSEAIFTLSKGRADRLRYKKIQSNDQLNLLDIERADAVLIGLETLSEKPWSFGKIDIPTILGRSGIVSEPLRAFGQAYIGLLTGMDEAFVVDQEMARQMEFEEDIVLPYAYRGAEVRRYSEVKPNARVIYPYKEGTGGAPEVLPESQLRAQYPHIYGHLLSYKDALRKRQDSRRFYASGPDWYRHLRPGSFNYVRPGKLIIKGIDTRTTVGVLDVDTAFNGANCPGIILDKLGNHSPHYILALLNSKVVSYHLRMVCPPKLGGYTRFNANNINDAPIRVIAFDSPADVSRHDQMVVLVERMLDLHKRLAAAQLQQEKTMLQRQIEATDKQIDLLVYELYGLTEEEIRVVEGAQALPGY